MTFKPTSTSNGKLKVDKAGMCVNTKWQLSQLLVLLVVWKPAALSDNVLVNNFSRPRSIAKISAREKLFEGLIAKIETREKHMFYSSHRTNQCKNSTFRSRGYFLRCTFLPWIGCFLCRCFLGFGCFVDFLSWRFSPCLPLFFLGWLLLQWLYQVVMRKKKPTKLNCLQ